MSLGFVAAIENLQNTVKSWDLANQAARDGWHSLDHGGLVLGKRQARVQLVRGRLRKDDGTNLCEHRRHLDLPHGRNAECAGELSGEPFHTPAAPERRRVSERQHVPERLDAAPDGLFQDEPLGHVKPVISQCGRARAEQLVRVAGLRQVAKQACSVDGLDRLFEVGMSRQQHPHRIGSDHAGSSQELGARHDRHPHVGEDDGVAVGFIEQRAESVGSAHRRLNVEAAAQDTAQAVEHVRLVVDA